MPTTLQPTSFAPDHAAAQSAKKPAPMQRVVIIGSSGAGKSTLARELGAMTGLPVIHLDQYFWHPGWVETAVSTWQQTIETFVQQPQWIIDGNYRQTLNARLDAADTVIFLDLPRWLCAWQAIRRRIQYRQSLRPDIAPGCQETLFSPDFPGFLIRIWQYPYRARPDVKLRLAQLGSETRVIHLHSRADIRRFLAQLNGCQTAEPLQPVMDSA